MEIVIRKGTIEDVSVTFELIQELASFEKAPTEVTNTIKKMKEDGFGTNPIFEFLVAQIENQIIGTSIFYYRYSTWKGKCLYLEDLIVTEKFRGKKIGSKLFEKTIEFAKQNNCVNLSWQVLDWNESAINFYNKYHTKFDNEWVNCKITL